MTSDKSNFGDLTVNLFDEIKETNLDFDSPELIDDDFTTYTMDYEQTVKRKLPTQN